MDFPPLLCSYICPFRFICPPLLPQTGIDQTKLPTGKAEQHTYLRIGIILHPQKDHPPPEEWELVQKESDLQLGFIKAAPADGVG